MIRLFSILLILLAAAGCASYSYTHTDLAADEKTPVHVYQVHIWRNAMDANAAAVHLILADGTKLDLVGGTELVDQGVVSAIKNVFQTFAGLGALALKFFGI